MLGKRVTANTTPVVLVDGSSGTAARPVVAYIKAATSSVDLGGAGVTAGNGYLLASTEAPLRVELVSEDLYVVAGAAVVVHVLQSQS